MIQYKEIAFTGYPVRNVAKSRKFYEGVLGLKLSRTFSKDFIEYDIGRGTLVLARAPDLWKPSRHGAAVALEVKDIDAAIEHMKRKKIKFAIPPQDFPTCRMFGVRDPDGSMVTLHQRKRQARKA